MQLLTGKTAIVTGGSKGIGEAIVRKLAEHGADVVFTYQSNEIKAKQVEEACNELGRKCAAIKSDASSFEESAALIDFVINHYQKIDILVNNAGMTSLSSPALLSESEDVATMSLDDWHRGMSRNMDTTFLVTKYLLPHLRNSKSGRIIIISSVTGHVMAMKHQPIYAAAKAAMVGLTKSIALDEAKYGITCNAILPGWIQTDAISDNEKANGASVPLGRGGTADEVASLVAYLASTEASYITGQALVIDGGNSIKEER